MSSALPLVITAQQLAPHLQDKDLLILDLSSAEHYAEGHIPGALSLDPRRLLRGEGSVPNKLPHPEQLGALFSELGITPDTQVVAYDDQRGPWAGRLIWTLACVGHLKASFLDGQLAAWKEAKQALETQPNQPQPTAFQAQYNDSLVVDIPWLLAQLHNPEVQIWDARSAEEYRGDKIINAKVGGHLPARAGWNGPICFRAARCPACARARNCSNCWPAPAWMAAKPSSPTARPIAAPASPGWSGAGWD